MAVSNHFSPPVSFPQRGERLRDVYYKCSEKIHIIYITLFKYKNIIGEGRGGEGRGKSESNNYIPASLGCS
jgi:hypothetical protein